MECYWRLREQVLVISNLNSKNAEKAERHECGKKFTHVFASMASCSFVQKGDKQEIESDFGTGPRGGANSRCKEERALSPSDRVGQRPQPWFKEKTIRLGQCTGIIVEMPLCGQGGLVEGKKNRSDMVIVE